MTRSSANPESDLTFDQRFVNFFVDYCRNNSGANLTKLLLTAPLRTMSSERLPATSSVWNSMSEELRVEFDERRQSADFDRSIAELYFRNLAAIEENLQSEAFEILRRIRNPQISVNRIVYDREGNRASMIRLFRDGSCYCGNVKLEPLNKPPTIEGRGMMIYPNDHKYVGNWIDGKCQGAGNYTFANGDKYEGNFVDGWPNGNGTFKFAKSGAEFEGNWRGGKQNGKGRFTLNGNTWEGSWRDNKKEGEFTITFANGDKVSASFRNNKFREITPSNAPRSCEVRQIVNKDKAVCVIS